MLPDPYTHGGSQGALLFNEDGDLEATGEDSEGGDSDISNMSYRKVLFFSNMT